MGFSKFDLMKFNISTTGNTKERTVGFISTFFANVGANKTTTRNVKMGSTVQTSASLLSLRKRIANASSTISGSVNAYLVVSRPFDIQVPVKGALLLSKEMSIKVPFSAAMIPSVLVSYDNAAVVSIVGSTSSQVLLRSNIYRKPKFNEVFNAFVDLFAFREIVIYINASIAPDSELIIDSENALVTLDGVSILDKFEGADFIQLTNRVESLQLIPLGGGALSGTISYSEGWL